MSNRNGRCFRARRRTKRRLESQGRTWTPPIRTKVPLVLRPFMAMGSGNTNQKSATRDVLDSMIKRYIAVTNAIKKQRAPDAP
jgi:hypothetical protein